MSTGASEIDEIKEAVRTIENEGNDQIVLMHCILNYPTKYRDANLGMMEHIMKVFPDYLVGYSDHTVPDPHMLVLTTAVLLGAKVIEKHFTLNKSLKGNDHYHSMDPDDLGRFTDNLKLLERIIGNKLKEPLESESSARKYARRSIVAEIDIPKDTVITEYMLTFKRPWTGISPKFLEKVIGKKAKRDIGKDEAIKWEYLG